MFIARNISRISHNYGGAEMALRISGRFCESSNRLTKTSHLVDWQMCFDDFLIASENSVSPAARSTVSIGTTKLSSFASSGIGAFGRTNAPVAISCMCGVDGEEGLAVSTTFAKWVGTATFGGEPMTS